MWADSPSPNIPVLQEDSLVAVSVHTNLGIILLFDTTCIIKSLYLFAINVSLHVLRPLYYSRCAIYISEDMYVASLMVRPCGLIDFNKAAYIIKSFVICLWGSNCSVMSFIILVYFCGVYKATSSLYKSTYKWHEPLARYVKLWVVHARRMPGTFSPPLRVSDPDMHHG